MNWRFAILLFFLCFVGGQFFVHADEDETPFIFGGNEAAFGNNIVLTIDDCSMEYNVRWLFEILVNRGLTATFFCNTDNLREQDPQLWRDIVAAGNELAYHTRSHMSALSPSQLDDDFMLFTQEIRSILNDPHYTIRYIRPPRGVWNEDWLTWGEAHGLITVKWNFTLPDSSLEMIYGILHNHRRGGCILLTHTGREDTQWLNDNIDAMMRWETADGLPFRLRSISDALNDG